MVYIKNFVFFIIVVLLCGRAGAQVSNPSLPPSQVKGVGIAQNLNENVPLDLKFRDESGATVELGDYFGEKPVLLALVYYECPMLCSMILNGVLRSMNALSFDAGNEFEIVTVSFDPEETPALAAEKKQTYVEQYGREGAEDGWHFLTGEESQIQKLTQAVGFNYKKDPESGEYIHASGIMVLTPQGKLSRYFYGVEYPSRDLRLALIEASDEKIGSAVDQILLYCYHYDPTTGKYGVVIMNVIRLLGTATVVILVAFIGVMLLRDRRNKAGLKERTVNS